MANKRTRELRKAAAANQWEPFETHEGPLPPPPRVPSFPNHDMSPKGPRRYDCAHAKPRHVELKGFYHPCPGCDRQDRRNRRHWFLLAVAVGLLLTVTCAARASSVDPCAPYSPVDGKSCQAPTQLRYFRGVLPVCVCPGPRVAGR